MSDLVLVESDGGVRTITMNRPDARNALNTELMLGLAGALHDAEHADEVSIIVLTGEDPAFCAGLDLRELGSTGANLVGTATGTAGGADPDRPTNPFTALWQMNKPVIGAINGPAVTGGLEIALNCDFLIASERARFGDTHARVGALPGGGMTPLLPQAVGLRRAKEMSLTGNFVDADEALRLGLVNHVVAHEELLPTAQRLAADAAGNDQRAVQRLLRNYDLGSRSTLDECWKLERAEFGQWRVNLDEVERRRTGILERGRHQSPADPSEGEGR